MLRQESAGWVFRWVCNQQPWLLSKPELLAGYPDPVLTLPLGPNCQPHPRNELEACIYCDELVRIGAFCPDVGTDQDDGLVTLNEGGRQTIGQVDGTGGEISRYQLERKVLPMPEYVLRVAWQGQQGRGVVTTAAPPRLQPQGVPWSQLFQRASSPRNLYA